MLAQNIDCGYALEPPAQCFGSKIRKIVYPCISQFYYNNIGIRRVILFTYMFPDVVSWPTAVGASEMACVPPSRDANQLVPWLPSKRLEGKRPVHENRP